MWPRPLGNSHVIKEDRHMQQCWKAPRGCSLKEGKYCRDPDCILEVWFPYSLGFDLIRFVLPATSNMWNVSLRVSQGKVIHWEISQCPQGKSFEILRKYFVLIYIGKVLIIKLISCNSI